MKSKSQNIVALGDDCTIDVDKLVESRLLMQANSGGGKSYGLRKLLEITHKFLPHIVIDVEGEFHTLRERFDYVVAGENGDCPADLKSAAMLARRLLELNVSAIIDIYELGAQRQRFVKLFLESLVNAPRSLWHPTLVVVDEAHIFAPEKDKCESTSAVIDLMTLGRKRGFCGVLATQRISKLHKDAAAECNNKLIGRSALDIDMARSAKELGFTRNEDMQRLRKLQAGTFFAFGPAISDTVREIQIGKVVTTHPKAGARVVAPVPPRDRVKKVLAQLADLPHEAAEEARTVGELQAQIRQLRVDLKKAQSAQPKTETKIETKTIEKIVIKDAQLRRLETLFKKAEKRDYFLLNVEKELTKFIDTFSTTAGNWRAGISELSLALNVARNPATPPAPVRATKLNGTSRPALSHRAAPARRPATSTMLANGDKLPPGEAAVLSAAIQFGGVEKKRLSVLTGYKRSSRDAYIARLRKNGLIEEAGDQIKPTDAGLAAIPDVQPLPTGQALLDFWYGELPDGERRVLEILVDAYPNAVEKSAIDDATDYKRSSRDAYLSRLRSRLLVTEQGRGEVRASDMLFDGAS